MAAKPMYFATGDEFSAWLAQHGATAAELLVGFHKRGTGEPSMTWPESVDAALAHGWIDGVRRRIDDARYSIRFTPRRATSIWSAINIAKVEALRAAGKMTPAGEAAFARRSEKRSRVYSFERETPAALEPAEDARFRAAKRAWKFFEAQAPWYRRTALHWVVSAKRPETREKRLQALIADSAAGVCVAHLRRVSSADR